MISIILDSGFFSQICQRPPQAQALIAQRLRERTAEIVPALPRFEIRATAPQKETARTVRIPKIRVLETPPTKIETLPISEAAKKPNFNIKSLLPTVGWQEQKMVQYKTARSRKIRNQTLEEIAAAFTGFIEYIARRRWHRAHEIGGDSGLKDVISAGKLGLLTSIGKWDPNNKPLSHS